MIFVFLNANYSRLPQPRKSHHHDLPFWTLHSHLWTPSHCLHYSDSMTYFCSISAIQRFPLPWSWDRTNQDSTSFASTQRINDVTHFPTAVSLSSCFAILTAFSSAFRHRLHSIVWSCLDLAQTFVLSFAFLVQDYYSICY